MGIICSSPPTHFSTQKSLQFNNVTLHTARELIVASLQGEKVFILNNHAHFRLSSPASSLMLMPLKAGMWMNVHFSTSYNIQCILNLALFPNSEKYICSIPFTSCLFKMLKIKSSVCDLCLALVWYYFQACVTELKWFGFEFNKSHSIFLLLKVIISCWIQFIGTTI